MNELEESLRKRIAELERIKRENDLVILIKNDRIEILENGMKQMRDAGKELQEAVKGFSERNMDDAHAYHDEIQREGCPSCEDEGRRR